MRTTLGQARSVVAKVANECATSEAVVSLVNRACERLLYKGYWPDSYARYRVCVNEACLTWPREIETIEAAMLDNAPLTVRDSWYEFLGSGPGGLSEDTGIGKQLVDRGTSVAFSEVTSGNKKIAVYCDGAEDVANKRIVVRFVNSYGNKQFTAFNGNVIEGESLALPAAGNYAYTVNKLAPGGLYHVVKPVTNYMVRLYEYDVDDATIRPLAFYEPKETVPEYRSSLIPNLAASVGDGCEKITVIVMGKKRYIPCVDDNDLLMIPNIEAVRLGVQAVRFEENNLADDAMKFWALAFGCLDDQTKHHRGSGTEQPMKTQSSCISGPAVVNMI